MFRSTLKRLAVGALTLTALATITFFLMKIIPGSPFGGQLAQLSPEVREMLYAQYNLDKSIPEQFMIYLQNAITGDFGDSMTRKGTAVTDIIARCLPATIKLGLAAFTIAITVGVTLGIVAAFTKRKWVENLVMFVATIGISVPSFLDAMLLMIVFGVMLGWLPIIGLKTPLHYIMPAFSLALYPISMITRLVRTSMKEVMKQDYIVLARSKGRNRKSIKRRKTAETCKRKTCKREIGKRTERKTGERKTGKSIKTDRNHYRSGRNQRY